jgi:hypothetical protein
MDFNSTVDLIVKDLDEAREIIDDLRNYPGVPVLQIELAKSKCKSASEVISLLKNLQMQPKSAEKKESIQITKADLPDPVEVISRSSEPAYHKTEPESDKENTAPHSGKIAESVIFADTFSSQAETINEQLGSRKDDNDLHDAIKHKLLLNLSDAIGVNDKFLFIREIFNGSPEAYSQAIKKLDETISFTEAKALIIGFAGENTESGAAGQLLELVKRKFPGNE